MRADETDKTIVPLFASSGEAEAARYVAQARAARRRAARMVDPALRDSMLKVAVLWEALARRGRSGKGIRRDAE